MKQTAVDKLKSHIPYLEDKRNNELEDFNNLIKTNAPEEIINNCFNLLLKKQKTLITIGNAIAILEIGSDY